MKKSISVVIPTYNDEKDLDKTLGNINRSVSKYFGDYELLVFNDHSSDRTGVIIDKWVKKNSKIRAFHNKQNMNVGYNFRMGIKNAKKQYVMLLPAPDSMSIESFENLLTKVGDADVVESYAINKDARSMERRIISLLMTQTLNLLFGLNLKYYFGIATYETKLAQKVKTSTNSFGLLPELLIRVIKSGHSYKHVPIVALKLPQSTTTAFRVKNVSAIIALMTSLFFDIHFGKRKRYD